MLYLSFEFSLLNVLDRRFLKLTGLGNRQIRWNFLRFCRMFSAIEYLKCIDFLYIISGKTCAFYRNKYCDLLIAQINQMSRRTLDSRPATRAATKTVSTTKPSQTTSYTYLHVRERSYIPTRHTQTCIVHHSSALYSLRVFHCMILTRDLAT